MKKSFLLAVLCALLLGCISAQAAYTNTRDDGVWLFPLSSGYYNSFTDWAGCHGYDPCPFCNVVHWDWGDGFHDDAHQNYKGHQGVDIGAGNGVAVKAAAGGTLYTTGTNYPARGIIAVIEHPLGNGRSYYSVYQHLSSAKTSLNGKTVAAGDTIGAVGGSGGSSNNDYAYHLHFGILLADSGKGADLSKTSNLGAIENGGWYSKTGSLSDDGYSYGRINANPSLASPAGFPTGCNDPSNGDVVSPLKYHAGSVRYTFNASEVDIGEPNKQPGKPALKYMESVYSYDDEVYFNWDATENTTHYNLYIRHADDSAYNAVFYAQSGESMTFPAGEYKVKVQSTNSNYWTDDGSNWLYTDSEWYYFTVYGRPETPILKMARDYCEGEEVFFLWDAVANATNYSLYITKYDDSASQYVSYEDIHSAESGVSRVLSAGSYRVQLKARNPAQYASNTYAYFTVYGRPATPELEIVIESKAVTFTWDAVENAEEYTVTITGLSSGYSEKIPDAESGVSITLSAGKYCVQVWAENPEFAIPSNVIEFSIYSQPAKPALKNMASTYFEGEGITFTWDSAENAEYYVVAISKLEGEESILYDVISNAESGVSRTLPVGEYKVRLYARKEEYSIPSDYIYFTVKPEPLLSATSNIVNDHIVLFVKSKQEISTQVLHIALYSEAGQMLDYIIVPTIEPFTTTNVVFDDNAAVKTAKVFLWDSLTTTTPIADAVEVAVR